MSFTGGYFSAKQLLQLNDYQNLSKLTDSGFFDYLKTRGYGAYSEIETLFIKEHLKLKADVNKFANEMYANFFYTDYDSVNTKQIYKALKLKKDYLFHPLGRIKEIAIYDALKHSDYTKLAEDDKFIFEAIQKADLSFKEMSDLIDNLFLERKLMFAYNDLLKEYFKVAVTLNNILIIKRSQKLEIPLVLSSYGLFDKNDIKEISSDDESFKSYLNKLFVGHLEALDLTNLERLSKQLKIKLYQIIKPLTYQDEGVVVSYLYLKILELKNIKTLYLTKKLEEMIIL